MRNLKWILSFLRSVILLAGVGLWTTPPAGAALQGLPPATPFYRSPEARFASGQTTRLNLERNRLRTELEITHHARRDGKDYVLKADDMLMDTNCLALATLKGASQLLDETRVDARVVGEAPNGARVEVTQTQSHWARVKFGAIEGWLPAQRLEARTEDLGVFLPVIDTFLRDQPSNHGRILTTVPRRARLAARAFLKEGWIEVTHNSRRGYVDAHHLVGRADFAVWAWKRKGGWMLVSHRDGVMLKNREGESVALNDILAFAAPAARGIITRTDDPHLPPLRAQVDIVRSEAVQWAVSQLDGHGEVWWRQNSSVLADPTAHEGTWLTTEELLQRNVFSYAFTGTKSIQGLVSAQGVWKTDDGLKWTRIAQFGTQDLPVGVHPEGGWFVGSFRSMDRGATFEPFIRWDNLASTIADALQRAPRYVKLQKVEPISSAHWRITIDTGVRRLSLRTMNLGSSWQAVR